MAPAKATIAQPKLPSFVTTPSELQAAVVSHVLNPHDLKCLRLVCEQADAIASAELYREVAIDLLKWGDNPLFVEGRSAHKYVRQISFNVSDQSLHFSHDAARRGIRSLLFLLPRNTLKRFYTPIRLPLDEQTVRLIATTQRDLAAISLGPLENPLSALPDSLKP